MFEVATAEEGRCKFSSRCATLPETAATMCPRHEFMVSHLGDGIAVLVEYGIECTDCSTVHDYPARYLSTCIHCGASVCPQCWGEHRAFCSDDDEGDDA